MGELKLGIFLLSSMVEHAAVNRGVVGSSPTGGAKVLPPHGVAAILLLSGSSEKGPLAQLVRADGS